MLILQITKKPQGREERCSLLTKESKPCSPDSLLHRSENSLKLELPGAPFTQRAQIQEPGSATLRKGCKEIPKKGTSKNEVFCFTASPANVHQGVVSATFGHCFPGTDSYRIIILLLPQNK